MINARPQVGLQANGGLGARSVDTGNDSHKFTSERKYDETRRATIFPLLTFRATVNRKRWYVNVNSMNNLVSTQG